MKRKTLLFLSLALTLGILLAGLSGTVGAQRAKLQDEASIQAILGTTFTYQGRLSDGGSAASGTYDFEFRLYDAAGGGSLVSGITRDNVTVTDGLFAVELDFGGGALNGEARWLEIGVRPGSSTGAYTALAPRQPLSPAPYALALPGLWTQPNATSPNVIGGYSGNNVTSGVVGATIGGGGAVPGGSEFGVNTVTDDYGTIGGGRSNLAGDQLGTTSDASFVTIGGGLQNIARGSTATIGGGESNRAPGDHATISGGYHNEALGDYATVSGGIFNDANGNHSFAAGYGAKANHQGAFVWADSAGTDFASTANDQFLVRASGGVILNVAGGALRLEPGAASPNVIGGYGDNSATGGVVGATISGGGRAPSSDWGSNDVSGSYNTIGGGNSNQAGGSHATISGGYFNQTTGDYTAISGGLNNNATGLAATVGGGSNNQASGDAATVPGGYQNEAQGNYSFAAGVRAQANYAGCFVWGDSTFSDVTCSDNNQFIVRASGGVTIYTNSGLSSGVILPAGAGAWSDQSDRNLKENLVTVDAQEILARLVEIPITTWNYKSQDTAIRHIGPMAQDFYAAFGMGEGDRHISTLDADGVALVAVQGLYQIVQTQDARIEALETRNAALQQQFDDLATRMAALEGQPDASVAQPGNWPSIGLLMSGLLVGLVVVGRKGMPRRLWGGER